MNFRKLNALVSFIAGVLSLYALYLCVMGENGPDFTVFRMFEVICMAYAGLYYIGNSVFLIKRKKGVFIPFLRYSVFITVTGWCLYGIIFLDSYYHLFSVAFQNGVQWFRYAAGAVVLEWLTSEKGHFWKQFTWAGMLPVSVYAITGTVMSFMGYGIDIAGHCYPFMDVSLLGAEIAVPMLLLVLVEFYVYAKLWIGLDQTLRKQKKRATH